MNELPTTILHAVRGAITAYREQDLEPPTAMIVGEDVQRTLLYYGLRPSNGTWGTIMGVEIRGVSERIEAAMEGRLVLLPQHLRIRPFKQQILGEFPAADETES